jgi:hypothetical protein
MTTHERPDPGSSTNGKWSGPIPGVDPGGKHADDTDPHVEDGDSTGGDTIDEGGDEETDE